MASTSVGHQGHRSSGLKQKNKSHKTGRHRSKGTIEKNDRGRVEVKSLTKKAKREQKKAERRNQAKQLREKKRGKVLDQKRKIGSIDKPSAKALMSSEDVPKSSAPHLVAIIGLSSNVDTNQTLNMIKLCDTSAELFHSDNFICNLSVPRLKKRFSFIVPPYGNLAAVLEAARVADTLLCVMSAADQGWDQLGQHCLTCLFAQGLPSTVHVVQGIGEIPVKRRNEVKKNLYKVLEKRFPKEKLYSLDSEQEGLVLLHHLANHKQRSIRFRELRPHILARKLTFEPHSESHGTLQVSGYVRGHTLPVNGLVHLPGYGDFQINQIDRLRASTKDKSRSLWNWKELDNLENMENDVEVADPSRQESLESEVIPDPMEREQTWPTEEEIAEAKALQMEAMKAKKIVKKVPKGTSEYQASWIIDSGDELDDDDLTDDDDSEDDEEMAEFEPIAEEGEDFEGKSVTFSEKIEYDTVSMSEGGDARYDDKMDYEEERAMMEKFREERMDQQYPDEMDTPQETHARIRFARYRGLKSFRTSPWDPRENLPMDYGRIYQFENFSRTRKRVFRECGDDENEMNLAKPGFYVTVHVANVPKQFIDGHDSNQPLVIFGLLPYEQKMSVINFVLKRSPASNEPIKSKEPLIFQVGYRKYMASPIFSQHTLGSKHKFERFWRPDTMVVASVFAPITFPPAPVLVFKERSNGVHCLVGTGTVMNVGPERIAIKRIVLSGHPFKINKRHSVVRYMFFNREDIKWFKPIELHTKWGRRGHIKEPLGTHGHMKCLFDKQLKSQDTILMNLYKRMFPKWTYNPLLPFDLNIIPCQEIEYFEEGAEEDMD